MIRPSFPVVLLFLIGTIIIHVYLLLQWKPTAISDSANMIVGGDRSIVPKPSVKETKVVGRADPLRSANSHESSSRKQRVKAAIVILVRNEELEGLEFTLPQFEKRFNKKYGYPYVFLNDVEFTDEFKRGVRKLSSNEMKFGLIPKEHWSYPEWVDQEKAKKCRAEMEQHNVIYGGSESYRHMCRFNSGFFYRHPLLAEYDYYWRVEPTVKFFCDMIYDPFEYMHDHNKDYGFVIMLPEYEATIPTFWETVKNFRKEHADLIPKDNALEMFVNAEGNYNLCHFWSNFEIGNLNFFRSHEYSTYFDFLDKTGNFFYERWGDAPVHSVAVAMFLPKERIHFFEDIGYYHGPFTNCPANPVLQSFCDCDPKDSVSIHNKCYDRYVDLFREH